MNFWDMLRAYSRSPYGERGLKYWVRDFVFCARGSLSLRRAWIEIHKDKQTGQYVDVALLTESVD